MPLPINLLKAFEKGYIVRLYMTNTKLLTPPPSCAWLILDGVIHHENLTDTQLMVREVIRNGLNQPLINIPAATASATVRLFPSISPTVNLNASQWTLNPIDENDELYFQGDASAWLMLKVLEWRP